MGVAINPKATDERWTEAQERRIKKARDFGRIMGADPPLVSKPMTHEERQELIRRPITFHVYGHSGHWSGTGTYDPYYRCRARTPGAYNNRPHVDDEE